MNQRLQRDLKKVLEESNFNRQVRRERELRIEKRKARKKREKTDPIELDHYKKALEILGNSMGYPSVRITQ